MTPAEYRLAYLRAFTNQLKPALRNIRDDRDRALRSISKAVNQ